MVAITISTILLLMAMMAFRSISHAIAAGNELSIQNSMLLMGWRAALDDADYYRSYADANPPYNKGFMRVRTSRTQDGSTPMDQGFLRRPFQPIQFGTLTDPDAAKPFDSTVYTQTSSAYYTADKIVMNPEVLQAHDPRSIDRSGIWCNMTSNNDAYRYISPMFVHGDTRYASCTDMRWSPMQVSPLFPTGYPTGTMSYPVDLSGAVNPTVGNFTETIPNFNLRPSINMALPLIEYQLFSRLSLFGATDYTSMGYNIYYQDQNGNGPGNQQGWATSNLVGTSPIPFPDGGPMTEFYSSLVWPGAGGGYLWRTDFLADRDYSNFFGMDFFPDLSEGCWALGLANVLSTTPGTALVGGGGFDGNSPMVRLIDYNRAAIGALSGNVVTASSNQEWNFNGAIDTQQGDVARNDRNYRSRTVRLPYNITDGESANIYLPSVQYYMWGQTSPSYTPAPLDYDSKPPQYPSMETTMLRYFRAGGQGQLIVTTASIQMPNGTRIDLPCTPYTTSYRGARQHWRLYSAQYSDHNAIGDFYDTAAGPFYASPSASP